MWRALSALGLAAGAAAGPAQQIVTSPGADAVSVTVYRNPSRATGAEIDLRDLGGYALISETRHLRVPAGESTIRFEGVAGGIIPVSAIVSGLPGGVIEKNREARLLSPAALIDGSLGQRVHLRRTSRATGKVSEGEATILSVPEKGLVLRTRDGIEALYCANLPETPVYTELPPGLSAKPTLTVTTHGDRPTAATVTLTYLANRFDWQANYVARIGQDGRTLDLFAWLTLANGNGESFAGATTQVIAGRPNHATDEDDDDSDADDSPRLVLSCWANGTTTSGLRAASIPLPTVPTAAPVAADWSDIVVTASRIQRRVFESASPVITAAQEDIGDLKLYRIPEPVTVSAHGQKQVALFTRQRVPVDRVYRFALAVRGGTEDSGAELLLRIKNKRDGALGLALPAGRVAVFEEAGARTMLAGEPDLRDLAAGEDVELTMGPSPGVRIRQTPVQPSRFAFTQLHDVTVTNARNEAISVEVSFSPNDELRLVRPSRPLGRKDGRILWAPRVPANGSVSLHYTTKSVHADPSE